ncbi:hypothetical protein DXT76_09250 [Halobacillus trueperi]|uniref:Uncharacterized protein n=1 Tax=Halobacillus trueperi TaxID=156205 RepID=A0A3D8VPI9_9BACI|nr:hypothetical protein DXT76_09250 [Halobacillus trueperi]
MKVSLLTGLVTFALCFIVFLAIDSPSPYLRSLVVAFIIFEISFHHLFGKVMFNTEQWMSERFCYSLNRKEIEYHENLKSRTGAC